jgi:AcrR family transcriptional regulator
VAARKYEQRLRAQSAEETRRRILDALAQRLREAPAELTSVEQIARLAGVARATVYLVFGSRAGLFCALAGDLLDRGGFGRMLGEAAHPDAREGLRRGIRATVAMFAAERDVLRALYSMAQLDADAVGGAVQRMDEGRAIGARHRAERLADQHGLRPDVTVDEAANLLWVLTSFDAFDLLYTGRGLAIDEAAGLLCRAAERSLCVPHRITDTPADPHQ